MKKIQLINRLFWYFFASRRLEMDFGHCVLFEDLMLRRWNNRFNKCDVEDILHQIDLDIKGDIFNVIFDDFDSCFNFFKNLDLKEVCNDFRQE